MARTAAELKVRRASVSCPRHGCALSLSLRRCKSLMALQQSGPESEPTLLNPAAWHRARGTCRSRAENEPLHQLLVNDDHVQLQDRLVRLLRCLRGIQQPGLLKQPWEKGSRLRAQSGHAQWERTQSVTQCAISTSTAQFEEEIRGPRGALYICVLSWHILIW